MGITREAGIQNATKKSIKSGQYEVKLLSAYRSDRTDKTGVIKRNAVLRFFIPSLNVEIERYFLMDATSKQNEKGMCSMWDSAVLAISTQDTSTLPEVEGWSNDDAEYALAFEDYTLAIKGKMITAWAIQVVDEITGMEQLNWEFEKSKSVCTMLMML